MYIVRQHFLQTSQKLNFPTDDFLVELKSGLKESKPYTSMI